MGPGSLVMLSRQLSMHDINELRGAGYPVPELGKDIYEVKKGPYLTMYGNRGIKAVTFVETGEVEWCCDMFIEIDEPKSIDLDALIKV